MTTEPGQLTPEQQSRAGRLFDDLLSLEVNVIIKEGMTARKMPDPRPALFDIAENYESLLSGFADLVLPGWDARARSTPIRVMDADDAVALGSSRPARVDEHGLLTEIFNGSVVGRTAADVNATTFRELRSWAIEMAAVARVVMADDDRTHPELLDGKCVLFKRINRNCQGLEEIAAALATGTAPLTTDQRVELRKIWEVGAETVVMQTIVQLDGDIITRVQPGPVSSSKVIQDLHRQSVDSAVRSWQFLGQTLVHILGSVLKRFL